MVDLPAYADAVNAFRFQINPAARLYRSSNMVKKVQKDATKAVKSTVKSTTKIAKNVKGQAQQFFTAGVGAMARAQSEGTKVFEKVVKEGLALQRKTQAVAEDRITEATSRVTAMAGDITTKATGQWDKLEGIFEERVAKALNKLGVPSAKDIDALVSRIDALNKSVQKMSAKPVQAAAARKAPIAKTVKTAVVKVATAVKAVKAPVKAAAKKVAK